MKLFKTLFINYLKQFVFSAKPKLPLE